MAFMSKKTTCWGVIRRKARGAVESGRGKKSTSKASTETIDRHRHQQQPQDHQVQTLQQGPSEIVVEDELRLPESRWVASIKEKLKQADRDNSEHPWEKHSIYQIPRNLKNGEDKAYIPQFVSLGPYHHGKEHLLQMDKHKWRSLQQILRRTNHKIDYYLYTVKEVEVTARACYEGTISTSSDEFVEMMVLDGCFIIELFQGFFKGFQELGYLDNDPIFSMRAPMLIIQQDMIMLENQIPFFILDRLYCLQVGRPYQEGFLAMLALRFFDTLKPTYEHSTELSCKSLEFNPLYCQGALHCLQLFRWSLLHQCLDTNPNPVETWDSSHKGKRLVHCVTELRKAGIKFSKRKTGRFWDIQFKDGMLQIPQLVIHDGTRSLFLNLMALEQCHFYCRNQITSYVFFMDRLINSPEDVGHLQDCGIIEHWLGSNAEVADLFNGLSQEVAFDINDNYLSALSENVNNYSSHIWYRWQFILKNEFFSNPWSTISVMAATLLLVLTFTQTFYAVYSYHRPRC